MTRYERNDKGQASIEYLMNYAWAIALIIIVGVAIFALDIGGLRNRLTAQSSQVTQAGETLAVTGYSCDSNQITVAVENNGGNKLTGVNMNVTGISGTSANDQTDSAICGSDSTLFPGDSLTCDNSNLGSPITCDTAGDPYDLGIRLKYTDDETGIDHTPIRNVTGTSESG